MRHWKRVCRYACSDRIPHRSLIIAAVVGSILNVINQGDAFVLSGSIDWTKLVLTFAVPYFVSTYGAVSYKLKVRDDQ